MSENISVPVFTYEDLRKKADEFLKKYHPSCKIPIPIEEIIEFKMGLNIIPMPGLHDLLEVDGFVSSDLREITVDEFVYHHRPGRYRFTLAHEVGHIVLHSQIYHQANFSNTIEWKAFINSIPEKDHGWLEYHGYAFAGLVLVPREELEKLAEKCMAILQREGIPLKENWDFAWERIAAYLARDFVVSSQVVEKRLRKDGIMDKYR